MFVFRGIRHQLRVFVCAAAVLSEVAHRFVTPVN